MGEPFKSTNIIRIHEINGAEVGLDGKDDPMVEIESHWSWRKFVVIKIDGKKTTVAADQLKKAVDNALNVHKY